MRKPWIWKGLVEMSWDKYNLFNLYKLSRGGAEKEMSRTTFQLRWRAKQLTIPYHAGHITQHQFLRQQQRKLPVIRRYEAKTSLQLPYPPTTMLTFAFMERHADVAIFRACFVPSVWEARALIKRGYVTVNGKPIYAPNYILEDGDIVQVSANQLSLLDNPELKRYSESAAVDEEEQEDESAETNEESSPPPQKQKKNKQAFPKQDYGLRPVPYMAPWMFVPEYLEVNYRNLSFCLLRSPTIRPGKCEIPSPYDEIVHQRAYDFYSNYRKL